MNDRDWVLNLKGGIEQNVVQWARKKKCRLCKYKMNMTHHITLFWGCRQRHVSPAICCTLCLKLECDVSCVDFTEASERNSSQTKSLESCASAESKSLQTHFWHFAWKSATPSIDQAQPNVGSTRQKVVSHGCDFLRPQDLYSRRTLASKPEPILCKNKCSSLGRKVRFSSLLNLLELRDLLLQTLFLAFGVLLDGCLGFLNLCLQLGLLVRKQLEQQPLLPWQRWGCWWSPTSIPQTRPSAPQQMEDWRSPQASLFVAASAHSEWSAAHDEEHLGPQRQSSAPRQRQGGLLRSETCLVKISFVWMRAGAAWDKIAGAKMADWRGLSKKEGTFDRMHYDALDSTWYFYSKLT